jgi:hypothetical protein
MRLERSDGEASLRNFLANDRGCFEEVAQIVLHFLRARAGKYRHQRPGVVAVFRQELLIELLSADFVEVRMADERGVCAALAIPLLFEWHATQHVIDKAAHLANAMRGPGPNLRRRKVEHRNAVRLRTACDPPVEAGIVDQHHGVRSVMAEVAIGPPPKRKELVDVDDHAEDPHHGQHSHVRVELAAGRGHLGTAVADELDVGAFGAELPDQIGAVEIAAGFAGREEDFHGRRLGLRQFEQVQGVAAGAGRPRPSQAQGRATHAQIAAKYPRIWQDG